MIWDREMRAPVKDADGKPVVRLKRGVAEGIFTILTGGIEEKAAASRATWLVTYGTASVECAHEVDAKLLARELIKKGHTVSARTLEGWLPARSIEPHQLPSWLAE